jgi:hypothetical protein
MSERFNCSSLPLSLSLSFARARTRTRALFVYCNEFQKNVQKIIFVEYANTVQLVDPCSVCGSLPWDTPTGYQIATDVTLTKISIQATAR